MGVNNADVNERDYNVRIIMRVKNVKLRVRLSQDTRIAVNVWTIKKRENVPSVLGFKYMPWVSGNEILWLLQNHLALETSKVTGREFQVVRCSLEGSTLCEDLSLGEWNPTAKDFILETKLLINIPIFKVLTKQACKIV